MNESIAEISYCPTWLTNNYSKSRKTHPGSTFFKKKKNIINADKKQEKQLSNINFYDTFFLFNPLF